MTTFSQSDIHQIENHGLSIDIVNQQLNSFKTGFPYADIVEPATSKNGIQDATDFNNIDLAKYYRDNKSHYKIVKFVPASGAATRMFKDLFEFMATGEMNNTTRKTLENIEQFAFYDELKKYLPENATDIDKISCIISESGLNYGNMPKALIAFHKYATECRTAAAEHLVEGAQYAASNNVVNLHFTVSPEHIDGFKKLFATITTKYESEFGVKYNIELSTQKKSTDTIAVNLDNTPFRNADNTLLFRPAGHGALIENLNDINADFIFIKNIDNVCPDDARADTISNKESIAGVAMYIQKKIFAMLQELESTTPDLHAMREFISRHLGLRNLGDDMSSEQIRTILNRPLRVCGIIKNTGEPGGGPFWVRDEMGRESLQIVEPGQIAPQQLHILKNGEFFSPTDIVCAVRDYHGNKFDLTKYVDENAGFISEKSKNGQPLRAMERPGLWNGSMANWNTVFIEVPITTFTPVKTILDLLTPSHKSA